MISKKRGKEQTPSAEENMINIAEGEAVAMKLILTETFKVSVK
jgi:hypothetical protein